MTLTTVVDDKIWTLDRPVWLSGVRQRPHGLVFSNTSQRRLSGTTASAASASMRVASRATFSTPPALRTRARLPIELAR